MFFNFVAYLIMLCVCVCTCVRACVLACVCVRCYLKSTILGKECVVGSVNMDTYLDFISECDQTLYGFWCIGRYCILHGMRTVLGRWCILDGMRAVLGYGYSNNH